MNDSPPASSAQPCREERQRISPQELHTIFSHTNGMLLSQVSSLCQLEGTTIQNWVKRGLVPPAEKKLYELRTVSRILIVDLLRQCLSLEHIAFLLSCINGKVNDRSDDLMREEELYAVLYDLMHQVGLNDLGDPEAILNLIRQAIPDFASSEDRQRVEQAILAMLLAYNSARLKTMAERYIGDLIGHYPLIKELHTIRPADKLNGKEVPS